jgi:hypothetical protein
MRDEFIKELRTDAGITDDALTVCARKAYDLLGAGRPKEAEVVARGLVLLDKTNAYYRTLLATALLRKLALKDALTVVDEGLAHSPGNEGLTGLRGALLQRLSYPPAR